MNSEAIRNFKDFLLQYNRITESCFHRCINTLGQREMSLQEVNCSDLCVKKHTQLNFKVMSVYVEVQPQIVQKRFEDMAKAQQEAETQALNTKTDTAVLAIETAKEEIAKEEIAAAS